jgi:hypothetical protein
MTTQLKEIKPGTGLGNILFGMSREQLKGILGEPEEIESTTHDEAGEDITESWHYDEIEVSVSFEKTEDWKLCTIAVSSPDVVLNGKSPIGLSAKEITDLLKTMDVKSPVTEDWSSADAPDYHSITAEELEMVFWIEDGEVMDIQWGPYFVDEDTIRWPINGASIV